MSFMPSMIILLLISFSVELEVFEVDLMAFCINKFNFRLVNIAKTSKLPASLR